VFPLGVDFDEVVFLEDEGCAHDCCVWQFVSARAPRRKLFRLGFSKATRMPGSFSRSSTMILSPAMQINAVCFM